MRNKIVAVVKSIKTQIELFQNSKKQGFQYALFFALNLILLFKPTSSKNVEVLNFTRTFGHGVINNWDCQRLIKNFSFWFILFIVLFFSFWIFFDWFKNLNFNDEQKKVVQFFDKFISLCCATTIIKVPSYFSHARSYFVDYAYFLIFLLIFSYSFYLIFLSEKYSFDFYQKSIICSLSLSFVVCVIFNKIESKNLVFIQFFLIFVSSVILMFVNIGKNSFFSSIIKSSTLSLCFVPLMTSIYFELLNVMNAHGIFVFRIRKYYVIACFLLFCLTLLFSYLIYKKNLQLSFWKRISFPVLVVGFSMLVCQPALSQVYGADIFESANLSIPVSEFLNFGKLPVVNNYPGHMMTDVWQSFTYAFFNNDKFGAIFSPYASWLEYPIRALMFFYFVKTVLNDDIALLAVLMIPFAGNWNYFGMGTLIPLSLVFYFKKNTWKRAFIVWIAFIWCALYRLDMGFAFFSATIISLLIYVISYKDKKAFKQLGISFLITGAFGVCLWSVLCLMQNVNPILRLFEFLKLSASNLTWAYSSIGDSSANIFTWCYFCVPLFIAAGLFALIFSKNIKTFIPKDILLFSLIFGFSYFFNFQRGLVRHSLAEMQNATVLWDAMIIISLFLTIFLRKKNLFLPLFAIFILINANFYSGTYFGETPIANNILPKIVSNFNESRGEKKERVIFESGMRSWCNSYKIVMDLLLNDDETYLDFMNRTFVYSAIGRENPVYVTQSPLQLSGEFTQQMFIKEVEKKIDKIPVVIMPLDDNHASASLDGILNTYRYYKVSEFIFTHYKPMFKYSDFSVWVLNERYDDMIKKIGADNFATEIKLDKLLSSDSFSLNNCKIIKDAKNKSFTMQFTGGDPFFADFGNYIDLNSYTNKPMNLSLDYETDTKGTMQLFYTTENGEGYSEQKSCRVEIEGNGKADFSFIPTEYSRIRLDIPEKSTVKFSRISLSSGLKPVDCHYDKSFHSYNLRYLPVLWGEKDKNHADMNRVLETLNKNNDFFEIDDSKIEKTQKGNYLLLKIQNDGKETDERVYFGSLNNDKFDSMFDFGFKLKNGIHSYIFRISSDYLWYFENINGLKLGNNYQNIEVKILEGD